VPGGYCTRSTHSAILAVHNAIRWSGKKREWLGEWRERKSIWTA